MLVIFRGHRDATERTELSLTMQLDVFTLLLVLATGCVFVGSVLLVIWRLKRSQRGLFWWSISLYLRSMGLVLILLRGRIADVLSIDLALAMLVSGVSVSWAAARLQSRQKVSIPLVIAPVALWLIVGRIPEIHSSMGNRLAFVSTEMGLYALAIAWEFRRQSRLHGHLRTALAGVFLISGGIHLSRAVYMASHHIPDRLPEIGNLAAVTFYVYLLLLFAGGMIGIGFHWEQLVRSLKYEAEYDDLTRVFNRRALALRAERLLEASSQPQMLTALLLFDLDHFKSVNDRFGHQGGDAVLRAFSNLIRSELRNVDLFGRIGGEEFAAVLPNVTRDDARGIAERLRRAVETLDVVHSGATISVTVSIGLAAAHAADTSLAELMSEADVSLYEAKVRGRNRVHGAEPALQEDAASPVSGNRLSEGFAG